MPPKRRGLYGKIKTTGKARKLGKGARRLLGMAKSSPAMTGNRKTAKAAGRISKARR